MSVNSRAAQKGIKAVPPARGDATDLALFVRSSSEKLLTWNRQRIVDALVKETYIDLALTRENPSVSRIGAESNRRNHDRADNKPGKKRKEKVTATKSGESEGDGQ